MLSRAAQVAEAIAAALTDENPRARRVVGSAAALQMAVRRLLPDAVWDRLLMWTLAKRGRIAEEADADLPGGAAP